MPQEQLKENVLVGNEEEGFLPVTDLAFEDRMVHPEEFEDSSMVLREGQPYLEVINAEDVDASWYD